jgi:serine/threonine protein kinase/Tfp pilus assembly protein PilF
MVLSIPQIALMSRLLDEALPLDTIERRLWLERLPPEHEDLAQALRHALLPEDSQARGFKELVMLPKLAAANEASALAARGLKPGDHIGPYELGQRLGAGGMAEVWLARRADGAFRREVALKLPTLTYLRTDLEQRFARERDILASLEHPHIARFYDAGVDPNGLPYFAMEYVRGERLTAWCDARHLGVRERLKLVLQVLDALHYAHAHHVIHRDIKPSNILVNEAAQVRLLDFGVAKLMAQEGEHSQLTVVYGRALTPDYASPEQARGGPVEPASDMYSVGVLLYELLTGCLPYRIKSGSSAALLEQAIIAAEVTRPSMHLAPEAGAARGVTRHKLARQLRGDLDAIALKAVAKTPPDRYGSATALASDLQRYLSGEPVEARPDHLAYRFNKRVQRHPTEWAAAAAAVLAAAALAYALTRPPRTAPLAAASSASPIPAVAIQPQPDKSIAVLPFLDMSEKQDQQYFSDGLSEELIDHLVRSADLKVIARTSSFQFKGKNEDARSIARKLGVTHLLEGSVRKAGQQLRITAQLIRASDGAHLWSQTYDRNLVDIFKVQDEIGEKVAQALNVALRNGRWTANAEPDVRAYNLVLEGNYFKARRTLRDSGKAVHLYRQAIDIDPDYALAWARLAGAYLDEETLKGPPSNQQNRRVLDALDRAIRLDPNLVWAYYTRAGFEVNVTWNWAAAQADIERIRAIDPRSDLLPGAFGDIALMFGEVERAIELYQHDIELNPLDPYSLEALGSALCAANRLQQCLESRLRLQQLHPEFGGVNSSVGIARLYLGQFAAALEAMQRETNEDYKLGGLAMLSWALEKRTESDAALKSLTEKFASSDAYGIAEVHAYRREIDAAFRWLERAYRQHHAGMFGLKTDPLLRNLHDDPRFQALLTRMKLTRERPAEGAVAVT